MDVKCPVCDKPFPPNLITYHAEHCLFSSFSDTSSGPKRSISEILEYESDVATATASYPRKRQHYGHSSPTTTVAYYPKEGSDYRRPISNQRSVSSVCSASNSSSIGLKDGAWISGGSSSSSKPTPLLSIGGGSAPTGWSSRQAPAPPPYRSVTRIPDRRESSSGHASVKRPYIRASPTTPASTSRASLPSLSSVAPARPPSIGEAGGRALAPAYKQTAPAAAGERVGFKRPRPPRPSPDRGAGRTKTPEGVEVPSLKKPCSLHELLRPVTLSELVGQSAISGSAGSSLRTAIAEAKFHNTIVWGPPGCGKTSLLSVVSQRCGDSGGSWRCRAVCGATVTRTMLLPLLTGANAPPTARLLLLVDELHCMTEELQLVVAAQLDRADVTLVATSMSSPRTGLCAALASRCEVYSLVALSPCHMETLVRRALRRVQAHVLSQREAEVDEDEAHTQRQNEELMRGCQGENKSQELRVGDERRLASAADIVMKTLEEGGELESGLSCWEGEGRPPQVVVSKTETAAVSSSSSSAEDTVTECKPSVGVFNNSTTKTETSDNGIEDMSDEEDESILDVLTKDIDQIGKEFNKIDHEMTDIFKGEDGPGGRSRRGEATVRTYHRKNGSTLRDLTDLDYVSDDDLPDHGDGRDDLESIDSSEAEDDMEEEGSMYCFKSVGMTAGAVTHLSCGCGGDARVALDILQRLLREARVRAARAREQEKKQQDGTNTVSRDSNIEGANNECVSGGGSREIKLECAEAAVEEKQRMSGGETTRIANYGSSGDGRPCREVSYEKDVTSLTTDDISSDEDNEDLSNKDGKQDCLDNVSDVSENSVHLDGKNNNSNECRTKHQRHSGISEKNAKADGTDIDSDDALSDALSADDALDYGEMDDDSGGDEVQGESSEIIKPSEEEEVDSGTSFSNTVVVNGRLTTMLFSKGQQAIAPSKVMKTQLNISKRPVRNKLLFSNPELMRNAVLPERPAEAVKRPGRRDRGGALGRVYAVIAVPHVKAILQHRTPAAGSGVEAALHRSISGGSTRGALYWTARLLRDTADPGAVARVLLQAAATCVGVGDATAVSLAVHCVQTVPLLSSPHSHHMLANTAFTLARAHKNTAAVCGLQAAIEELKSCAVLPAVPSKLCLPITSDELAASLPLHLQDDVEDDSFLPQ